MRSTLLLVSGCTASSLSYLSPALGNDGHTGLGALGMDAALKAAYGHQVEQAPPPISLVPTDGSELALTALEAKVSIDGPIAHTELHFTFHNAENRLREGRFSVALPGDAAVDRFAMKTDGGWREASVVARQEGRVVYERFLKHRVDPALLERDAGNAFSARIYPIAANADKELIIAYDHLVSSAHPYDLNLRGLPIIPKLSIAIDDNGSKRTIQGDRKSPDDVRIAVAPGSIARIAGDAFVARLEPPATSARVPLQKVAILVDTSASRAPVMGKQAQLVGELVRALPADTEVAIAAYDQEVTELYRGRAGNFSGTGELLAHGALGASDLGAALSWAAASPRVILVGDGTPTLGETDAGKLAARLKGVERVDALQVGTSIDRDTVNALLVAGAHPGGLYDRLDLDRLTAAPEPVQSLAVAGATALYPATTKGIAPGEPVWVFGHRADVNGFTAFIGFGGTREIRLPAAPSNERVKRLAARAEVAALTEQLPQHPELAKRIEALGLANHLVTSQTSLLVLETDDDARRVGIATPAQQAQAEQGGGEVIRIRDSAPTIDPTSTTQGITIDRNYLRNIPVPGRTFESVLGSAAGSQSDGIGVSISGSSSLENHYYVDGVNIRATTNKVDGRNGGFGGFDPPPPHDAVPVDSKEVHAPPYNGTFLEVLTAIHDGDKRGALRLATRSELANPGDVASLFALGEALEAMGAPKLAARAYGSLIDLYPSRAELARAAGQRLDRLGAVGRSNAIDAYRRAIKERPDQIGAYRLLAIDLWRTGDIDGALATLDAAKPHATRPSIQLILTRDAQLLAAAIAHQRPERADALTQRYGALAPDSLRFVLAWETDANDVDLHVYDAKDHHAFFGSRAMPSGGELLDDVTDGFGPEMFYVEHPKAAPYHLAVHYYNRGPEGVGLGSVQVLRLEKGKLTIEDRPFVIQNDNAMVDLGVVD